MIIFTWLIYLTSLQHEEVRDVFLSAFAPQGRSTLEELNEYFDKKVIPRFEKGQLVYCAFVKDKMIGFAIYEKWDEKSYYLAEMAIAPEFQGQGIGKQLVFSILEKEPATSRILLVTEIMNLWSQAFYKKIGFKPSSFTHPDYPENFIGFEYTR